jgi:hypothetical protein
MVESQSEYRYLGMTQVFTDTMGEDYFSVQNTACTD